MFKGAGHMSLSWTISTQSKTMFYIFNIHFQYFPQIGLSFPSDLFLSYFPGKSLYASLPSSIRATCPTHLIVLDMITQI